MNKKIAIGLGLILGGFAGTFLLFYTLPFLMGLGHIAEVVGIVFLGKGIQERKVAHILPQPVPASVTVEEKDGYVCSRCGKRLKNAYELSLIDTSLCKQCGEALLQERKNKPTTCNKCGAILPFAEMHTVEDEILCHSCFLIKYTDLCFEDKQDGSETPDNGINTLRKEILAEISKKPAIKYQIAALLWQDAASCFPNEGFSWDGAWFFLDLKTKDLLVKVSTYPDQFGASREQTFSISPSEFHRIAKQYNMRSELQVFQTEQDWEALFDKNLINAVSAAEATLKKEEEATRKKEQEERAIKIPKSAALSAPKMNLDQVLIEIYQRYSNRKILVTKKKGAYHIDYCCNSHLSPDVKNYARTLSSSEGAWLETQVDKTIKNPNNDTWQSLAGGDSMNLTIQRDSKTEVRHQGNPLRKYSDLQYELEKLAQYGSRQA